MFVLLSSVSRLCSEIVCFGVIYNWESACLILKNDWIPYPVPVSDFLSVSVCSEQIGGIYSFCVGIMSIV